MADFKKIRESAIRWAVFGSFAALFMGWIAYALTYTWSDPAALRGKTSGNQLQSSQWNLLVGNVDNLNERLTNAETNGGTNPTGAVMAFYGTSCPTGWSPADGTVNGVKKTDGTTGTLDLRGEFIRWLDTAGVGARNVDVWRWLASAQKASRMMGHNGNNFSEFISSSDMECLVSWLGDNLCPANSAYKRNLEDFQSWSSGTSWATSWTSVSSTSTIMSSAIRPRNVALLYCVKN